MGFSKITEDLNIIAKLSDEPNIEDGLTSEQLKAKFDESGLTLQEGINKIVDELELKESSASIGADLIYAEDNSEPNVQAKLVHLYNLLQEAVMDGIDLSAYATKEELSNLETEINTSISNKTILTGSFNTATYKSSNEYTSTIDVGFKPDLVLIYMKGNDETSVTSNKATSTQMYGDNVIRVISSAVQGSYGYLTDNGFYFSRQEKSSSDVGTYYYIAIKLS